MSESAAPTTLAARTKPKPRPFYLQLWFLVLMAMALGIALGDFDPAARRADGAARRRLHQGDPHADRADHFLHGGPRHCPHGRHGAVGRVALKALIYFEVLTTIALVIGLVAVNVLQPGAGMNVDLSPCRHASVATYLDADPAAAPVQFLLAIIPQHLRRRVHRRQRPAGPLRLGAVRLCAELRWDQRGKPLTDLIGTAAQMFFRIVGIVMWAAPIGAFGAIAFTVGKFGAGSLLVARQAPGQLLRHLPDLHLRRAVAGRAGLRLQPAQASSATSAKNC